MKLFGHYSIFIAMNQKEPWNLIQQGVHFDVKIPMFFAAHIVFSARIFGGNLPMKNVQAEFLLPSKNMYPLRRSFIPPLTGVSYCVFSVVLPQSSPRVCCF